MAAAPQGVKPGVNRERLVEAALRLLTKEGPGALQVRRIAAAAGCSTIGLYSHFGGKAGLLDELYRLGFRRLHAAFDALVPTDDPVHDLIAHVRAYRATALDAPELYGLMFERSVPGFRPPVSSRREGLETFQRLAAAVQRCMDAGAMAKGEPEAAAYLLWGTAHGLVSIELTHRAWGGPVMKYLARAPDRERVFDRAIRSAVDGLR